MWEPRKKWDRNRPIILKFGMACALGLVLMAFNLKTEISESSDFVIEPFIPDEIDVIRTPPDKKKKVLPPPAPPEATKMDIPDDTEFVDEKPPEPTPIDDTKVTTEPIDVPDPVYHEPVKVEKPPQVLEPAIALDPPLVPMLFAQRMPVFGECEMMDEEERRSCSNKQLIKYVYDKVRYPNSARLAGAEGTVLARFIIDENGKISELEILREFGFGSGKEVRRILENMPDWEPGKQNGRRVPVIMTLPVKFALNKG